MFLVAIHSHFIKENMYTFRIPRKNQHWVYFDHLNLKLGPFGPPLIALGLKDVLFLLSIPKQDQSISVNSRSALSLPRRGFVVVGVLLHIQDKDPYSHS